MTSFLPRWATPAEAEKWLEDETGEAWPLPRLIEAGLSPHVWIEPPAPGDPLRSAFLARVFDGRAEGFLAEFVFASDTARLAIDRTAVLTFTRTPSGELAQFDPPLPVALTGLRFDREHVQALASTPPPAKGPAVKRSELIAKYSTQWPTIKGDLDEASRRMPWLLAAKAEGGGWHEGTALALARAHGRIVVPADPATLQTVAVSWKRGSK